MGNLTCSNCGATLKPDVRFCEFCSTAVIHEVKAEECYTEYDMKHGYVV